MANNRKLSPTEIGSLFEGKDRTRNSRYVHTLMSNPNTPDENVEMIGQYVISHPEQFLSDEEIAKNPNVFKKAAPYRRKDRLYDGGGYSYDASGQCYDPAGNMVGGWHDGGSEQSFRDPYRPSKYRMSKGEIRSFRRGMNLPPVKNDPAQVMSPTKVNDLMFGLKSNYARTRYFQKVRDNPESNIETVDNLILWKDQHTDMFVDEKTADRMAAERKNSRGQFGNRYQNGYQNGYRSGYGGQGYQSRSARDYDRESWDGSWKSKDDFEGMSQNKKSLFSRFFGSKDRNKNSKLALKILVDPQSSQEDVTAVRDIVNESPRLFFRNGGKGKYQQR